MNCSKCGAEIQEGNNFCPKCGAGTNTYQYDGKEYTKDDILHVAKYQNWVEHGFFLLMFFSVIDFLIKFGFLPLPEFLVGMAYVLYLTASIFYFVAYCLLRAAEKGNVFLTVLGVILSFFPVFALIVCIIAIRSAYRILEAAGIKCGLLGVSKKDLNAFRNNQ